MQSLSPGALMGGEEDRSAIIIIGQAHVQAKFVSFMFLYSISGLILSMRSSSV